MSEIPPLPDGAVFLGPGRSFQNVQGGFRGFTCYPGPGASWQKAESCSGNSRNVLYAAFLGSEVAILNGHQAQAAPAAPVSQSTQTEAELAASSFASTLIQQAAQVVEPEEVLPAPETNPVLVNGWKPIPASTQDGPMNRHDALAQKGIKHDDGKPLAGVLLEFNDALMAIAEAGTYGVEKYSRGNWKLVEDGQQRYQDAFMRHLLQTGMDESGLTHMQMAAWNFLAYLQLSLEKK